MKFATHCFEPFTIATMRVFISALTLGGYCYFKHTNWLPQKKEYLPLTILVIIGFCYPFAMQPLLISLYGSAFVGIILAVMPLFTLILGRFILKAKIDLRQVVGILGGLFCTYLLFRSGLSLDIPLLGFLMALTVPLGYTLSNIYIKRDFSHINPIAFTATSAFLAFFLMLPFAISQYQFNHPEETYKAIFSIIVLGTIMSGFALALFYYVIQQSGPLIASLTNYIVPVFALFWGCVDGEKTNMLQIIAIFGIMIMVYITQPASKKTS